MVIVEVGSNNYEASIPRTIYREYNIILQNTPLFSNFHRMGGKQNTLTKICNQIIVPCNQLVHMVIVDDATYNFKDSTLRIVSI
jgi:hypothetical protein